MKDWVALQVRYQRDSRAIQLGGLASNLSRIAWFAQRQRRAEALPIVRESKYFTEWAALSCSAEQQGLLAEVQFQLAVWERAWATQSDASSIANDATRWSNALLEAARDEHR